MLGCGVVDTFSFNMTNLGQGSTLKNKFQIGALIAALMNHRRESRKDLVAQGLLRLLAIQSRDDFGSVKTTHRYN